MATRASRVHMLTSRLKSGMSIALCGWWGRNATCVEDINGVTCRRCWRKWQALEPQRRADVERTRANAKLAAQLDPERDGTRRAADLEREHHWQTLEQALRAYVSAVDARSPTKSLSDPSRFELFGTHGGAPSPGDRGQIEAEHLVVVALALQIGTAAPLVLTPLRGADRVDDRRRELSPEVQRALLVESLVGVNDEDAVESIDGSVRCVWRRVRAPLAVVAARSGMPIVTVKRAQRLVGARVYLELRRREAIPRSRRWEDAVLDISDPAQLNVVTWKGISHVVNMTIDQCRYAAEAESDPLPVYEYRGEIRGNDVELKGWALRQIRVHPKKRRRVVAA